jgi:hypothetical protein
MGPVTREWINKKEISLRMIFVSSYRTLAEYFECCYPRVQANYDETILFSSRDL